MVRLEIQLAYSAHDCVCVCVCVCVEKRGEGGGEGGGMKETLSTAQFTLAPRRKS